MIRDFTLGQFYPANSYIHKLDAACKIIFTFIYIIFVFIADNFFGYAFLAIFTLIIIKLSKVPLKLILRGLKPVVIFMAITAVLNMFMTGETVIWHYGFLKITSEGLMYGIKMVLRIAFLVTGTSILTFTTSPVALTDGLEKLFKPLGIIHFPYHEIAMMMTIALRFIPTLLEETDKIMKAQTARGADFETGNLISRAKALIPLLIPLFINSFKRADELATAMESRCYNGGVDRTRLNASKAGLSDALGAVVMIIFGAIIIMLNLLV